MFYLGIVLLILASLVAIANFIGMASAIVGMALTTREHGYSCVPIISLLFCTVAYFLAGDAIGVWAFLPAALDPGTWVLFILPVYLIYRLISSDEPR